MASQTPNGSFPPKTYGITKLISLGRPFEVDIQRNVELEKFLVGSRLYESKKVALKRDEVLHGRFFSPWAQFNCSSKYWERIDPTIKLNFYIG